MHPQRLIAMDSVSRTTELTRRYGAEDLHVFSPAERARFLPCGTSDAPINRSLAFELLYRLEPELWERLVAAERIHPGVIEWFPFVERAVEVGAGTGRLTSHLMTRCRHIVAVEPARPMRDRLAASMSTHAVGRVDIVDGFFDALPAPDSSADLVVTCAALERDSAHGGDAGLAEMERVCAPGGMVVVVWPNHVGWLNARGFTHVTFPGDMWMEFRDVAEAIEMTEIFYPHAIADVRSRGAARVGYDVIGVNPPRDLAFKVIER
jgi:SAM-dependent methyltransferase